MASEMAHKSVTDVTDVTALCIKPKITGGGGIWNYLLHLLHVTKLL